MERFIRPSISLGAICGVVFGILLLIPFISPFMFFFLFFLAGIIIVVFLKKTDSVGLISMQDGCFIGALAGFGSLLTTAAVYLPISYIFARIFNSDGFSINKTFSIMGYDFLVVSMMILFTAILSAIINAFSGMITAFFFEKTDKKMLKFEDHLEMERVDEIIE